MVAPLDPLRGPSGPPQAGVHRPSSGPVDAFELEFQRLLDLGAGTARPIGGSDAPGASGGNPPGGTSALNDDVAASLEGVSESLKRATAYINSARAYFRNTPGAPSVDSGIDSRS